MKEMFLETIDDTPCDWGIIINEKQEISLIVTIAINWLTWVI